MCWQNTIDCLTASYFDSFISQFHKCCWFWFVFNNMSNFEDIIFMFCENQQVQHNYVSRNWKIFYLFIPPITSEPPNLHLLTLFKDKYLPYWMTLMFTSLTHTCFYLPQVFSQFLFSSINCTSIFNHCCFVVPSFVSPYDYFPTSTKL